VVVPFDRALDLKELAGSIGAGRLSFGRPERLLQYLGVEPGAVTPFALINDGAGEVTVVLDRALLALSPSSFHPLVDTRTTAISPEDLLVFLRASGHEPRILPL
jgi:Ala-tRNA(Pro) deacylase